ncbi:hypothetical protein DPMN_163549 [Dreissena polymorpha]|uniref:Uncharacterized protein n=1 Tax=Dreissena polymorpha TaxID=45954 RepID=A0A9D4ETG1_DREPO|nr:hypothetical protein DPMN_163549 [Dreissena polymorpha]
MLHTQLCNTYSEANRHVSPRRIDVILKGNFGWARPMLVRPWVENVDMDGRNKPCCHKRFMLKQNFGWAGRPWIDRINRCRNEKVIVKGNFGWLKPMWADPWGG